MHGQSNPTHSISRPIAVAYGTLAVVIFAIVAGAVLGAHALLRANTIAVGDLRTGSVSVDSEGASAVDAEIVPAFGEMTLSGGAQSLLELDYVTNILEDPGVTYHVDDGQGILRAEPTMTQGIPNARRLSEYRNEWEMRLDASTPISLSISMGAGKGDLDLRGLALTGFQLDTGAGEALVDMRGGWSRSFDTTINAGTGKVTVLLPDQVGTRLEVNKAIGAIYLSGLEKGQDFYTNAAYGTTDVTLDMEINVAVGEVDLVVLDADTEYVEEQVFEKGQ
jgi:hypothetical protein